MKLRYTRAMVTAAISGALNEVEYDKDPVFGVNIPRSCPGVPSELLNPANLWADQEAYRKAAHALAREFIENQKKKIPDMSEETIAAGPKL